jgi:hypothetical protein
MMGVRAGDLLINRDVTGHGDGCSELWTLSASIL